jgi:hypothetical protein
MVKKVQLTAGVLCENPNGVAPRNHHEIRAAVGLLNLRIKTVMLILPTRTKT